MSRLSAAELLERARRVAAIASAQTHLPGSSVPQACQAAIDRAAAAATGNRIGYGGQVTVVFVTIAETR